MELQFSRFEILTGSGALFLCLVFICVFTEASDIEGELSRKVNHVVDSENLFWASVEAQGQSIVLTGAAPDQPSRVRAGELAASIYGVTGVDNQIAVIGEAGTCQRELDSYLADQRVTFKSGRADFADSSFALMDMLAGVARGCDTRLEVAGHTDNVGDAAVNLKLSQRRADAVRKYLVQSGVEAEAVRAIGYGETQPVADNSTDQGREQNRRIEFRVLGGAE